MWRTQLCLAKLDAKHLHNLHSFFRHSVGVPFYCDMQQAAMNFSSFRKSNIIFYFELFVLLHYFIKFFALSLSFKCCCCVACFLFRYLSSSLLLLFVSYTFFPSHTLFCQFSQRCVIVNSSSIGKSKTVSNSSCSNSTTLASQRDFSDENCILRYNLSFNLIWRKSKEKHTINSLYYKREQEILNDDRASCWKLFSIIESDSIFSIPIA